MENNKMKKVLHISSSWGSPTGIEGISMVIMNLFRNMDNTKIVFDIVSFNDNTGMFDQELQNSGGKVFRVIEKNKFKSWKKIINIINQNKYDAVVLHINMSYKGMAMWLVKIFTKVPVRILHSHNSGVNNSKGDKIRSMINKLTRRIASLSATYLFACSSIAAKWTYDKKSFEKKGYVIKNGINYEKFLYSEQIRHKIREQEGWKNDEMIIGHIGRISYQKNQEFLIKIMESLSRKTNAKCVLIGSGGDSDVSSLDEKISKSSACELILKKGIVQNVNEYLQAFDCFVFPSRYEGLGITAIEAQAAGLPTICSEFVPDEAKCSDLFIKLSLNDSSELWANKIIELVNNSARSDMSEDIIKNGYDIKKVSCQVFELIEGKYNAKK